MENILEKMSRNYHNTAYSTDILFRVQDIVGPADLWPNFIREVLLSSTLKYSERIKISTFFWVNGLRDVDDWIAFIVRIKGPSFGRYFAEMNNLLKYFHQEQVQEKYFSFCVVHKQYEYLNGNKRDNFK